MRANTALLQLLAKMDVDLSKQVFLQQPQNLPALVCIDDSVFLQSECASLQHLSLSDFQDRTGLECFINHVHIPFRAVRHDILDNLAYIAALQKSLRSLGNDADFTVIWSIDEDSSTIRFHKNRQGEKWLSVDLEGYQEPVGVFDLRDNEMWF